MSDWLKKKSNRYLAVFLVAVILIVILAVSVADNFRKMNVQGLYPDGGLTEEPMAYVDSMSLDVLSYECVFPHLEYVCNMPKDSELKKDYIITSYDGMDFIVMVSQDEMEEMCERELPGILYFPIVGRKAQAKMELYEEGYFMDKQAKYAAYTVRTQVSTLDVVSYTMCYTILSQDSSRALYIYASTEDKEKIEDAHTILRQIAGPVRKVEDVDGLIGEQETTIGENNGGEGAGEDGGYQHKVYEETPEGPYYIEQEIKSDYTFKDGVMLIEWSNVLYEPATLSVYNTDGRICSMDSEYSRSGHYVYRLGAASEGNITIIGSTMVSLEDVRVTFFEMEQYELLYHTPYEIPHEE